MTRLAPDGTRELELRFAGGSARAAIDPIEPLPARSHYFIGHDPARWVRDARHWDRLRYREPWPGIDVVFHAPDAAGIEFDLLLEPGVDLGRARLAFDGIRELSLDEGDLVLDLGGHEQRVRPPVSWQERHGRREPVAVRYALAGPREVRLVAEGHDRRSALVIDPVLTWSTYYGGSLGEAVGAVAIHPSGGVYVAGWTTSLDLPLLAAAQPAFAGGFEDAYVARFDAAGALVFATYLGSSFDKDRAEAVTVDPAGNVWVAGMTPGTDFPVRNAWQPLPGGAYDAFLAELSPAGNLLYSTYFGGSREEVAYGLTSDAAGRIFMGGSTNSDADFPLLRPIQPVIAMSGRYDGFVAGLLSDGTLFFSTYLGGTASSDAVKALAVDASGHVVLTGETPSTDFPLRNPLQSTMGGDFDAFVAAIDTDLPALLFSTYLGGASFDYGFAIDVAPSGTIVVAGSTDSADFPVRNPWQPAPAGGSEAFLSGLAGDGSALQFSTWVGGSGTDTGYGVSVDGAGAIALCGRTASSDFPTRLAFQAAHAGGNYDGFFARFDASASTLLESSYLGGGGDDVLVSVAVEPSGAAVVGGWSSSPDYPTRRAWKPALAGSSDVVLSRLDPCTGAVPGPVGNTLRAVRDRLRGEIAFTWVDIAVATDYALHGATGKALGFPLLAGTAPNGSPGLGLPFPPEPLLLYNLAGAHCGNEGPF